MTWRPDIFLWECMYVVLKNYTAVRKQRKIIIICLLCWPPSRQPCNSYMAKKVHEVLALIWQRMSAHIFVEVLTLSILDVWLLIYFFLFDTPSKARDFFGIPLPKRYFNSFCIFNYFNPIYLYFWRKFTVFYANFTWCFGHCSFNLSNHKPYSGTLRNPTNKTKKKQS